MENTKANGKFYIVYLCMLEKYYNMNKLVFYFLFCSAVDGTQG
jgi:hypothetical protein